MSPTVIWLWVAAADIAGWLGVFELVRWAL